jgi:hypothetical protein
MYSAVRATLVFWLAGSIGMSCNRCPSKAAIPEFVVPKSMPMIKIPSSLAFAIGEIQNHELKIQVHWKVQNRLL